MPEPARAALTFLGCGDAFSSGGRLHTCFHVAIGESRFLLDCGATALVGMKRFGVDPLSIETVIVSHFHADHFCGLPFLLLESKVRQRTTPLTLAGPPGIERFLDAALRALFPGSGNEFGFPIDYLEYRPDMPLEIGPLQVRAFPVRHTPETLPHAVRVEAGDSIVAYSGDTEWTDALLDAARDADLFVCEAGTLDKRIPNHVDYATVRRNRGALRCRNLILTHMGPDVLAAGERIRADGAAELASDGLTVSF
ncbi:MAG: MBL fold metallo-hydrolase [Longimicrobiales bacterium]